MGIKITPRTLRMSSHFQIPLDFSRKDRTTRIKPTVRGNIRAFTVAQTMHVAPPQNSTNLISALCSLVAGNLL